jgi:hypothetical protein
MRSELTENVPGQIHLDEAGDGLARTATRLPKLGMTTQRIRHHMLVPQSVRAAVRATVDASTDRIVLPALNVFPGHDTGTFSILPMAAGGLCVAPASVR